MPHKIDPEVRLRAVRLVTEHRSEYSSETQIRTEVAESLGVSQESVRRWVQQHQVDTGLVGEATSEEREEIRRSRSEIGQLRAFGDDFIRGGTRPPRNR